MALLDAVRELIVASGLETAETIWFGREPPTPVHVTTLYLLGGPQADGTFDGGAVRERTVQIRVRDAIPQVAHARLEALHALFVAQRPLAGYMGVIASSEPFTGYPTDASGATIGSFSIRVLGG